jgi:hypothetical protein
MAAMKENLYGRGCFSLTLIQMAEGIFNFRIFESKWLEVK